MSDDLYGQTDIGVDKFISPVQALVYWYRFGDLVREYGMPSLMIADEKMADSVIRCWDYPEWFYVWCDLDKIINKLDNKDKAMIHSYFKTVFDSGTAAYVTWRYRGHWIWFLNKFWELLPTGEDGLREDERKKWKGEYRAGKH